MFGIWPMSSRNISDTVIAETKMEHLIFLGFFGKSVLQPHLGKATAASEQLSAARSLNNYRFRPTLRSGLGGGFSFPAGGL